MWLASIQTDVSRGIIYRRHGTLRRLFMTRSISPRPPMSQNAANMRPVLGHATIQAETKVPAKQADSRHCHVY